ncbi:MAG: tetratricopeptide repeat protein [Pyrinomonadaceae bacterium]
MFRRYGSRFAMLAAGLLLPALAHAQTPEDSGRPGLMGRHSITGILFMPDRAPADRGIQVRLSRGANDVSVWTDQDGKFNFGSIVNSTYTITVNAGDEYELLSHRLEVTLPPNSPPQAFFVNLQLRLKPNSTHKPQVVDARLLGVPARALEHFENAKAAIAKSDTKAALNALLLAVAEHPEFIAAHTELGIQYLNLGQLERSEEHLRIAVKLKPNAYEPLANLGIVLSRTGKHEEAETVLLEVLKIRNDSTIAYFYLGRSLLAQKKFGPAEASLKNALVLGGDEMSEAHRSLANLYLQHGEDAKALAELEAYLLKKPGAPDESKLRETVQQIKDLLKDGREQ